MGDNTGPHQAKEFAAALRKADAHYLRPPLGVESE